MEEIERIIKEKDNPITIKFKAPKELTKLFEHAFIFGHLFGADQADREVIEQELGIIKEFADIDFEKLPFEEAIQNLRKKIALPADVFYTLEKEAKNLAFTVSRIESQQILKMILQSLVEALEEGQSFNKWKKELKKIFENIGISPLNPFHIETVFRVNIMQSYNAGRWQQFQKSNVVEFLQYHAIDDDRVRPTHLAMNGRIYPKDHPIWAIWYPPNGFNCRCHVTAITRWQAKKYNIRSSSLPPDDVIPDEGWEYNPALVKDRAQILKILEKQVQDELDDLAERLKKFFP